MKFLLIILLFISSLNADELKKMIGHLLIVGFDGLEVNKNSQIIKDINTYELGGVILFDIDYKDQSRQKNISSKAQLKKLTSSLKLLSKHNLLISIDQEGGQVARLKPKYGFDAIASAKMVSTMDEYMSHHVYSALASSLASSDINCNFAPVLDLELSQNMIAKKHRSFGSDAQKVAMYGEIVIDELRAKNILAVAKHFPGHGSSKADSHDGFVDITNTWSEVELEPYKKLIALNKLDMIMSAHVFNAKLDSTYPATLSHNINTKLLRDKLGFDGVLVSDDMQMGAITKNYSLKEALTLALNSGVDMLIFGNQLAFNSVDEIVETIYTQVKDGKIPLERIEEANRRINGIRSDK
ncbi:MAG: glycoside hydrolase family 3 N-terminal domain-containing protein [Sulfurimonas sp.]|nr:glycoside hydrolase family 3 N-terminal domain-containing protein [Sulfurimonadaceae bacterium]